MPELDGAVVATDVMIALGLRGHDVKITHANGPRLMRLGELMLAEFGIGQRVGDVGAAPGDGDDQALVAQQGDGLAYGSPGGPELLV